MRVWRSSVLATVLALGVVLSLCTAAEALVSPVKVLGGRETQYYPFSDGTWLLWSQNSVRKPAHYSALAKRFGSARVIRLNAKGSQGAPGGFLPNTDKVVMQQYDPNHGVSDLVMFDISRRKREAIHDANTDAWEWRPRISKKFLLFTRSDFSADRDRLLLYKRDTGFTRTLANISNSKKRIFADSVGERYATYSICGARCVAFIYDSSDGSTQTIPTDGRLVYATAVAEATGALYFVRSGEGCGANVGIFKMSLGAHDATKIVDLPAGMDIASMSVAPSPGGGHVDLYFDRDPCKGDSDIYKVRKVDGIAI